MKKMGFHFGRDLYMGIYPGRTWARLETWSFDQNLLGFWGIWGSLIHVHLSLVIFDGFD